MSDMPDRAVARAQYQRVTAAMVAERAGVSVATVSLVANGKTAGRVSTQIIARVERAIAELNYVVDMVASSLSRGSSSFVILVAPDIATPFFGKVINGVKEALGPLYQLLLSVSDLGEVPQAHDVRNLFGFRPAGLLIYAPNEPFLHDLELEAPTVVLDGPDVVELAPAINLDVASGAQALADHLVERGHRTVAYLDSSTGTATFSLRRKAFTDRATARGMHVVSAPDTHSVIDLDAAAGVFEDAWPHWQAEGVTAVVGATDTHAFGVIHAAHGLRIDVPGDLAVAGFDNLPYAAASRPSLTTVDFPAWDLGFVAGNHLRALMDGRTPDDPSPLLRSTLIVRESTARSR
jgi:LacI family transcriptional regulator